MSGIGDLFNPFAASAQWAQEQQAPPVTSEPPISHQPVTPTGQFDVHVQSGVPSPSSEEKSNTLGWVMLGAVLLGGAIFITYKIADNAFPRQRFAR